MQAEIMMIGTELLLGQILDTNAGFIGRALAEHGINLYQKTTVGDNPARIRKALDDALNRSDVILVSGGLGPTADDITRECIAELLERPIEFRQELYDQLCARFAQYRFTMSENNRKQATAPRGAIAIENPNGTAPGLIIEDARGTIICMPGVPKELEPMLLDSVIPYLRKRYGISGVLHSRVLKVCGLGESRVDAVIGDLIENQQNPTVGVLAAPDAVRIRITARAESVAEANSLIDVVDAEVRKRLPGLIMGIDDETLEGAVDALLTARGWTLAVAETLTGGMIAQHLTARGASQFAGGRSYARPASDDAASLAETARTEWGSDCGLGVVGDIEKRETRAVFLSPEGAVEWTLGFAGRDERSQVRVTVTVLERIRRHLAGTPAVEP